MIDIEKWQAADRAHLLARKEYDYRASEHERLLCAREKLSRAINDLADIGRADHAVHSAANAAALAYRDLTKHWAIRDDMLRMADIPVACPD